MFEEFIVLENVWIVFKINLVELEGCNFILLLLIVGIEMDFKFMEWIFLMVVWIYFWRCFLFLDFIIMWMMYFVVRFFVDVVIIDLGCWGNFVVSLFCIVLLFVLVMEVLRFLFCILRFLWIILMMLFEYCLVMFFFIIFILRLFMWIFVFVGFGEIGVFCFLWFVCLVSGLLWLSNLCCCFFFKGLNLFWKVEIFFWFLLCIMNFNFFRDEFGCCLL